MLPEAMRNGLCILRTPTDGFAEQNGRVAEPADCYKL